MATSFTNCPVMSKYSTEIKLITQSHALQLILMCSAAERLALYAQLRAPALLARRRQLRDDPADPVHPAVDVAAGELQKACPYSWESPEVRRPRTFVCHWFKRVGCFFDFRLPLRRRLWYRPLSGLVCDRSRGSPFYGRCFSEHQVVNSIYHVWCFLRYVGLWRKGYEGCNGRWSSSGSDNRCGFTGRCISNLFGRGGSGRLVGITQQQFEHTSQRESFIIVVIIILL